MAGEKIIRLYKDMADLTLEHCTRTCKTLGLCCSQEYCEFTIEYARDEYGVTLLRTKDLKVPLRAEDGSCTAAPHLRPLCTLHSCDISAVAVFKREPELTKRYYKLRSKIDRAEFKRMKGK